MSPFFNIEYQPMGSRKLYYEIKGEGYPIVLIHGYLGDSKTHWGKQFNNEAISSSYNLIAPDLRGFGKSQLEEYARWGEKHTKDELLSDIEQLISHLNIKPPIIGGYSVGAALAMECAKKHPVKGIFLVSPRPFARDTGKSYPYLSKERRSSSNPLFSFTSNLLWGILKRVQKRSSRKWIEGKVKDKELLNEFSILSDIPIIMMYANKDTVTPKIAFDVLKENIPHLEISEFDGDHGILHEKPDEFNSVLKKFFDSITT